jgi:TRAP-type C4-dicarboxylate transport system permease small subunit
LNSLAAFAGALLAVMSLIIVYDATLRALRLGAAVWVIDVTGIALIYITFLGSPWLLRERGHVYIEVLVSRFPSEARKVLGRIVCAACALLCLLLAYRAGWLVAGSLGETDVSAIQTPRWLRFAPVPVGFFFLATEFCRIGIGGQLFQGSHEAIR